jgi:hypothetical protein
MPQLPTIPGNHQALSIEAETLAPRRRGRLRKGEVGLTLQEKIARQRERNRRLFSVPPINQECDCGALATRWNSGKDAVCERCELLYTMAKRMEIQGRIIGFSRKRTGAYIPVEPVETQLELFHAEVVYLADETLVRAHGVYHLRLEAA